MLMIYCIIGTMIIVGGVTIALFTTLVASMREAKRMDNHDSIRFHKSNGNVGDILTHKPDGTSVWKKLT